MLIADWLRYTLGTLAAHRLRSLLTALGIAVGIAAVVLLTAIGTGLQLFVLGEFTQFGTHLIGIAPGKSTTHGLSGAIISNVRPLSLEDAEGLARQPHMLAVVPILQGNAAVELGERSRRALVLGVGAKVPEVWRMQVALGRFLPEEEARTARAFAVLGNKLAKELFGNESPLGQRVRVGPQPGGPERRAGGARRLIFGGRCRRRVAVVDEGVVLGGGRRRWR